METNNCASSLERHNTFCNTDRSQHCACIRSKMAEQKNTVFARRFGRFTWPYRLWVQAKRKRKDSDSHNTASCHQLWDILTPLSHRRVHGYLFFRLSRTGLVFCLSKTFPSLCLFKPSRESTHLQLQTCALPVSVQTRFQATHCSSAKHRAHFLFKVTLPAVKNSTAEEDKTNM